MDRRCPACGGRLIDESGNETLVCKACGNLYDLKDYDKEYGEEELLTEGEKEAVSEQIRFERKMEKHRIVQWVVTIVLFVAIGIWGGVRIWRQVFDEPTVKQPVTGHRSTRDDGLGIIYDFIDNNEHEEERSILTEVVMKADYVNFYNKWMYDGGAFATAVIMVIGFAAVYLTMHLIATIVQSKVAKTKLSARKFGVSVLAWILVVFVLGCGVWLMYIADGLPSPDGAKYSVTTVEYISRYTNGSGEEGDSTTYFIVYSEYGKEYTKQVKEDVYDCFSYGKGTYYLASAEGTLNEKEYFRAYPATSFQLGK